MTEAGVFYQLRDYPNLIVTSMKGIASDPNEWIEHQDLGIGYEGSGRLSEAIAEYQKAVALSNGDQDALASLAHAYGAVGNRSAAKKILHDWNTKSGGKQLATYLEATVYAGLGEKDRAIKLLNQAYRERSLELSWHLKADPRIDSLRDDPRFQELARRFGLPRGTAPARFVPLREARNESAGPPSSEPAEMLVLVTGE